MSSHTKEIEHIPVGTQVVLVRETLGHPGGAVGKVVDRYYDVYPAPFGFTYVVAIGEHPPISVDRDRISVLSNFKQRELEPSPENAPFKVDDHVIYKVVVGSKAYGLDTAESDTDTRGIYMAPLPALLSMRGVPEQFERKVPDEVFWELRKFLHLAAKANPNVLEVLFSPLVTVCTPIAGDLLEIRDAFVSRYVYQTYSGYAISQLSKIEQDLRSGGRVRWKHAMHLLRLLEAGIACMKTGTITVRVSEESRIYLMRVRSGGVLWEDIQAMRKKLQADFERAYASTSLPAEPDIERIDRFLIEARRRMR